MANQTVVDLQRRLQKLEDKDDIVTFLNQYTQHIDNQRYDEYTSCFLENATLKVEYGSRTSEAVGRAKIGAKISSIVNKYQGTLHSVTGINLAVNGDEATGSSYLRLLAIKDTSKPEENRIIGGPYSYTFRRTDAGWKIANIQLKRIWVQNPDTEGVFGP